MELEVEMVAFINPHLFWIAETSKEKKENSKDISELIRRAQPRVVNENCQIDDMVAVQFDQKFFRATVEDIVKGRFFCWLVDVGKLIDCDKVFNLPTKLKNIPRQANQASLHNLGYIKQELNLGAYGGQIKSVPTIIPEAGAYLYATTLLDKNEKLVFQMKTERDGVLYGDVIVHKNRRKFSLFEELAAKELIIENEELFKRIQAGIPIYKKTHLRMIHQLTMTSPAPAKLDLKSDDQSCPYDDLEELIKKPLLNGRRLRAARDKLVLRSSASDNSSTDVEELTSSSNSNIPIKTSVQHNSSSESCATAAVSHSETVDRQAKLKKLLAKRRKTDSSDFGQDTSTEDFQPKQTKGKMSSDRQRPVDMQTKHNLLFNKEETDSSDLESQNTSTDTQNTSTENYQNKSKMNTLDSPVVQLQKPSKISTLLSKLSTKTQCFEYISTPIAESPLKPVNENIEIDRDNDDKVSVSSFKIASLVKTIKSNKENKNKTTLPYSSLAADNDANSKDKKRDLELTNNRSQNQTTDEKKSCKSSKVSVLLKHVRARKAESENESFTSQNNEFSDDDVKSNSSKVSILSNPESANLTENEKLISPTNDVTNYDTDSNSSKVLTTLKNVRSRKSNSELAYLIKNKKMTSPTNCVTDDDTDNNSSKFSATSKNVTSRTANLELAHTSKNEKLASPTNYVTDHDTDNNSSKVSAILNNVRARKANLESAHSSENKELTSPTNYGTDDDTDNQSSKVSGILRNVSTRKTNSELAHLIKNKKLTSPTNYVTDDDTDNKSSKVSAILNNVRARKANLESAHSSENKELTSPTNYGTDDDTDNKSSKVSAILKNVRARKAGGELAKQTDENSSHISTERKNTFLDDEGSDINCENAINSPRCEVLGIKFKIPDEKQSKPRILPGNFMPAGYTVKLKAKSVEKLAKKSSVKTSSTEDDVKKVDIQQPKRKEDGASESHKSSAETESESQREDTSEPIRPEPFGNNAKISLFQMHNCKCRDCRDAFEEDDWETPVKFADSVCKKKQAPAAANVPIIRPLKLLKPASAENEPIENDIISINFAEMTRVKKQAFDKLLVHGDDIPTPIGQLSQTCLNKAILDDLRSLDYKKPTKIQKYAFPAITRNHHVFLIGDKGSGKTMSYLPTLYSFMLEKNERYRLLKDGGGPIAIILCSSSSKCELVYDYAKKIFSSRQREVRLHLETYPGRTNTSNIDILITLPTVLQTLLTSNAVNFKRLCHFVLEDGDVILDKDHVMVNDFLIRADKYLENRNCPKPIQMIVCAEHWTKNIDKLLKTLNKAPLVCIGNHLEAAIYGKVNFKMQFLNSASKEMELKKHLENTHKFEKSVVLCTEEQVHEIRTMFVLWGISCTAISNDMRVDDIVYLEEVWNRTPAGEYSVLVCTDYIYSTLLSVTSATLLIHYSMPKSWSQFIRRFSSLLENCSTPLNIRKRKPKITTLVLLDENCQPHMAKIVYYLGTSAIKNYLPEVVKGLFQNTRFEREEKKLSERVDLCHTLKLFGVCLDPACPNRHLIQKEIDVSENMPQNGIIKFKICEVLDLTHFLIHIKEHYDLKRNKTEFGDRTEEIAELLSKSKRKPISTPRLGHVYMYVDENKCRERVKLLEIKDEVLADVTFIDEGTRRKVKIDRLYKLSHELKEIPPQTIEIYLANLIPPYNDPTFSAKAYRKLNFILTEKDLLNSTMTAEIHLQLGNTLWLKDVVEEREMYDKSLPSMGYQLSRQIVKMEMAELNKTQLSKLYEFCKIFKIELPDYEVQEKEIKITVAEQAAPYWAFLEIAGTNEVVFSVGVSPDEFYIRIKKFSKQLDQLQKDIQREIKRPMYPEVKKLVEGQCYLAPDEVSGDYERVMIKEITEDGHAFCFFVDHGEEMLIPTSQLKHISNGLITKLPFQSIQCRLVGVAPFDQEWSSAATDFLYDFGYTKTEPKELRTLYLRVGTREQNYVIERQRSYSVLIKGAAGENKKLLNNLMIDCGLAIPNDEEVEDFIVAERVLELEEEEEEVEEENEHNEIVPYNHQTDQGQYVVNEEELELCILDEEEFVNLFMPEEIKNMVNAFSKTAQKNHPDKDDVKNNNIDKKKDEQLTVPMKALPKVDYYTPTCLWSQTDKNVKLTLKLLNVTEYDVSLKSNGRIFHFSTHKDEKRYLLNVLLFANVESSFQHTALGLTVKVTLTKKEPGVEWPRLPWSTENFRHIHYDYDAIPIEEENKQRILTIPISDDESDSDEEGCIYYQSDLDSEYDQEIPKDDD